MKQLLTINLISFCIGTAILAGPLHDASQEGNVQEVQRLIASGADVNAKDESGGYTPLHRASLNSKGGLEVVKLLVTSKAKLNIKNDSGETPLHIASLDGNFEVAEFLVKSKADVNTKNKEGKNSLHLAAMHCASMVADGRVELSQESSQVIKYLLSGSKAGIDSEDNEGNTPLHIANEYCGVDVIKILVENKANVNVINKEGETPLHKAFFLGNTEAVKFLVANKANINAKNKAGETALHLAISRGLDIVTFLVNNKADKNAKNKEGKTPLDLARDYEAAEIVAFLTAGNSSNESVTESQPIILGEVFATKGDSAVDLLYPGSKVKTGETLYVFQNGKPVSKLVVTQTFHTKVSAKVINTSVVITKGMSFGRLKEVKKEANVNTEKWSAYQGLMLWTDANKKCAKLKMRLPTFEELEEANKSGVMEQWKKELIPSNNPNTHWCNDPNQAFDSENGSIGGMLMEYEFHVHCIR
jgi:ankyrin repeat protein